MKLLIPTLLLTLNCFAQTDIINPYILGSNPSSNGLAAINVFYAKMDEASGTVVDSKNANNGTAGGSITYSASGKLNTAISAAGAGGIDFGDPAALQLTNKGSISVWVNFASVSGVPLIIGKINFNTDKSGYAIGISGAHPFMEIASAGGTNQLTLTSTTLVTSTWYHIVMTWDGSNIYGYVNGSFVASTTQTNNAASSGIHMTLFEGYDGSVYTSFRISATIDEVSIFNDALTSGQVSTLYNSGTPLAFSSFN